MQVLHDITNCPDALRGVSLAIGNFDGVHRGHQAVLNAARRDGAPAGVLTFEPHPRVYFQPNKPLFRLTPEPLKLRVFEALGLDMAVVLKFDAALASRPAADFVREILVENLRVSHVITGSDFHFGKGRDGNPDVLRALGESHGFGVTVVSPQAGEGGVFSSTGIREHLRQGNPRGAADSLGYWWRVIGEVIGGDKRGAGLGFPTANIAVPEGFALKHGTYAVRVHTGQGRYDGASYLGTRPSFDDGDAVLETFLFDFDGDLYGQQIVIEVIGFVRDDEKFLDTDALQAQMKDDCDQARALLAQIKDNDPMMAYPLGQGVVMNRNSALDC
jgi:riboflavin kinase/FMN adenylyltransferase